MWHIDARNKFISVSEEPATYIFRVQDERQQVPSKWLSSFYKSTQCHISYNCKLEYFFLQTSSRDRILLQKLTTVYPTVTWALLPRSLVDKQILDQVASFTQLPYYSELSLSAYPISLFPNSVFLRNISTYVPHYIFSYLKHSNHHSRRYENLEAYI